MPRTLTPGRARTLVAALTAFLICSALLSAPSTATPTAASTGGPDAKVAAARAALAAARSSLQGDGADPTLALRDLALTLRDLPEAERASGEALLRRPTDPADPDGYDTTEATPTCSNVVCVHYVTTTPDRAKKAWVDRTLAIFSRVHRTYVKAGYRAPLPDGLRGGNSLTDVYIANIDIEGYYGYCSTDGDLTEDGPAPAYCVVDNDYAAFPNRTPKQNLQVTAAHEYFHAVQFAYDVSEDPWLMEATATWVEDEIYDAVNDNRQYLPDGPVGQPSVPLDRFGSCCFTYGAWVFFRYLSEKWPESQHGLPVIVRDIWRRADAAPGAPDDYALQALEHVLAQHRTTLRTVLARFSRATRAPARHFEEGGAWPQATLAGHVRLSKAKGKRSASGRWKLNHLSSKTLKIGHQGPMPGRWRLRVAVNMTSPGRGAAAMLTVQRRGGKPSVRMLKLDKRGRATAWANFSPTATKFVELTLVNAGNDFRCNRGTNYSCRGVSKDDGLKQQWSVRAVRG